MAGPTPTFIELPYFSAQWQSLDLDDAELARLQQVLAADPTAGTVVPSSGGLRKLRFVPAGWATGKSGALRVYYANLPDGGVVVLATVFPKSAASDVSRAMLRELAAAAAAITVAYRGEGASGQG
jgi:hypothetical protein